METEDSISHFIEEMKKETKIFSDFQDFFDKAVDKRYLHCVHLTFSTIFQNEINFVILSKMKRFQEACPLQ